MYLYKIENIILGKQLRVEYDSGKIKDLNEFKIRTKELIEGDVK